MLRDGVSMLGELMRIRRRGRALRAQAVRRAGRAGR
jgi:hypothetical protein